MHSIDVSQTKSGIEWSLKIHGSRQILVKSQNLGIANQSLGILSSQKIRQASESRILKFESQRLANEAKVLICANLHKTTTTTTAKQRIIMINNSTSQLKTHRLAELRKILPHKLWYNSFTLGFLDHGILCSEF